ncbi:MAG: DUF1800 family protein [Verrucomicrobia bacterium]|nr:DUF1800 family protein [Verrucomicrobiota bacterium]
MTDLRHPPLSLMGLVMALVAVPAVFADPGSAPSLSASLQIVDGVERLGLRFNPQPAIEAYELQASPGLGLPFQPVLVGPADFQWTVSLGSEITGLYRVEARGLDADVLWGTTLLHRIAYGPTPDELDRVRQIGPEAYLQEQIGVEEVPETLDVVNASPRWQKVVVTGTGSSSKLYIYMDGAGDAYLDDLRLVTGVGDDGSKPNLLRNGDFEAPLAPDWTLSSNLVSSARSASIVHSGAASLHLVSTEAGESQSSSLFQTITPPLSASQTYTLSYWYWTADQSARLTIRLSGSGISSTHDLSGSQNNPAPLFGKLKSGQATLADLRAWHVLRAVQSPRQLHEVLRQFLENHFVTEFTKTRDYFDGRGYDSPLPERLAVRTEFVENQRWREALLKPGVTFHDLLKISAESPAMIVYLDTVTSRGDGKYVANENYARELCELFCFGVDNGYDQQDIVEISKVWTGWRLELLDAANEFNPLAARSTNYVNPAVTGSALNSNTNVVGVWGFKYRTDRHNNAAKHLFHEWDTSGARLGGKRVPDRFGPPWAGRDYSLTLPARSGNAGMQDGYDTLRHMADQPFTQEYISVKLCRLLVHDGFEHGYDFTDAETSPEEELIHRCMTVWETSAPKGQLRPILQTILRSDLFRGNGGSLQKVKTPLEFAVGTIRALRVPLADGSSSSETDGYGLANFMNRAGRMRLFDRVEPDGYPEDAAGWVSAGTLAERLRFVTSALMPAGMTGKDDAGANTRVNVLGVLQSRLGAEGVRDSGRVADLLLQMLFPAEGKANLEAYRKVAVGFLDTTDGGTASPLSSLTVGSTAHDQRIRGAAALLMSTQRFQEQ